MVGAQSSAMITSSPAGLPAVPNISLLQPGMLSASLLPGLLDFTVAGDEGLRAV